MLIHAIVVRNDASSAFDSLELEYEDVHCLIFALRTWRIVLWRRSPVVAKVERLILWGTGTK